ncbi:hypothetical protein DRP53_00820 [candidate division WOR-3 bacterium]|uniref:Gfo/Idh/MocA family oxidoreductase n=1 Tax=candidate division WOR-3 bacterium TaxID=2052148 RepID=A0A660SNW2_UNCW3|nr:MAG: hypothetical protein DRP53_00820 [candidate division WOR-3 bacterium]
MGIPIGVVGCGAHAQTVHIPILSQSDQFDLIGICDCDEKKLELVGEKYQIRRRYLEFQELLNDNEIEAVVIVTPESLHHVMVISALRCGKHVLCEKPMAEKRADAEAVAEAVRASDRIFALGLNERFRPEVQAIKQLIEKGELGKIAYLKAGWLNNWQDWSLDDWHRARVASGAFTSLGVHLLDIILWFIEIEPDGILGWVHRRADGIEDIAVAQIRFGRCLVSIEVGWSLLMERDFVYCNIFADRGAALLNPFRINRIVRGKMIDVTPSLPVRDSYLTSFRLQATFFANAIRSQKPFPFGWEDGLKIAKLIDGFYRSVATGEEVALN